VLSRASVCIRILFTLASLSIQSTGQRPQVFQVRGATRSITVSLPGVIVTARDASTGTTYSTASDDFGRYSLLLPGRGVYDVHVGLFGFAPIDRTVRVVESETLANFDLVLASSETTTGNRIGELEPATHSSLAAVNHDRDSAKQVSDLAADVPLDFSFVTGQVTQPVSGADSVRGSVFRPWPVHVGANYELGNSVLDANSYDLGGIAMAKPRYRQNSFGINARGTLPSRGRDATSSLFGSYTENHNGTPYDMFATVPTAGMRTGDLSGLSSNSGTGNPAIVFDPDRHQPFAGGRIPLDRMSPAAVALMQFMPLPNGDGPQNLRSVTSTQSNGQNFGLSFTRTSAASKPSGIRSPARSTLSISFNGGRSNGDVPNIVPLLGGASTGNNWGASLSHTLTKGFFSNSLQAGYSSFQSQVRNKFRTDVAASLGITGVSRDSFDWGLPSIQLTHYAGLWGVSPSFRADRLLDLSDAMQLSEGKHNLKWGGSYRRLGFDFRRSMNAAGSFMFTGFATGQIGNGVIAPGAGSDFADFLLGLPQKAVLQYSGGLFSFSGNAWALYASDDWRIANNVTINLGLRYQYVSPFSESQNRLATLDAPGNFSDVAVVRAGNLGPYSGRFPDTIVNLDRNNLSPHLAIAWRVAERLILRAGYSLDYDGSVYQSMATKLAVQPPFVTGQVGIADGNQMLTLSNGFPKPQPSAIATVFGTNRNLPLSYANIWTLNAETPLPGGFVLVTSYTGTRGSDLQMMRAPNRTATGLLLPNVSPFLWQTDEGSSIMHAGSIVLRKRLGEGLSVGGSYMFSRSIDDVPALGDQTPVAQNDRALNLDRALSAFNQTHRVKVDYAYELPFGSGKRWFNGSRLFKEALGGWSLTGSINFWSGFPLSPLVLASVAEVEAGGLGALRPDATGEPLAVAQPTTERFFNTGAFTPAAFGQYGNAGRNIIVGPSALRFDTAIAKSFAIAERHNLELQAQISNLLNTPQFTQVDTNLNSLSYGQITGVGPMRTVRLAVRYSF